MASTGGTSTFRRLRNKYRLSIANEDTYEELISFKLTRWTVYLWMSFFFIILVGFTIVLIAFTPLKYYIPGYGKAGSESEMQHLQIRADSIEHRLLLQQQYYDRLEKVLKGEVPASDTEFYRRRKQLPTISNP